MFYIALAFLAGALWYSNFYISLLIFVCLLYFVAIKRLTLICFVLSIFISILSYNIYSNLNNSIKEQEIFNKHHEQISAFAHVTSAIVQNNDFIKGHLIVYNREYNYIYYIKKQDKGKYIHKLKHYTCKINGNLTHSESQNALLVVKSIDFKSCKINSNPNLIQRHIDFINNQIVHSGTKYPYRIIALITGDTSQLNSTIKDAVKDIGIYHLLAVSGSHVAVITLIIYQSLVRWNTPLITIKLLCVCILVIFAVETQFAPSALRSIIAMIIILFKPKRTSLSGLNILAFVFLLLLIVQSDFLYDIGFQFSFLISLFLILAQPSIHHLSRLKAFFVITYIAQLGALLIQIYHFNQVQWIGILTNLIFVPLYSFIYFPLTLFFFLISHIFINIKLLNFIIDYLFALHDQLVYFFLKLNNYQWNIPQLSNMTIMFLSILVILSFIIFIHKKYIQSLALIILSLIIVSYTAHSHVPTLTSFDVGQGDSLLYQTSRNHNILIDTGGKTAQNHSTITHNIAKYHIIPSLKKRGVSKLDEVIITHPHVDHMGELTYLMQHIRIKQLVINSKSFPISQLNVIKKWCSKYNIILINADHINTMHFDDSTIQFLRSYIYDSQDKNEQSIVLLIKYHYKTILLMGDASQRNEKILMKKYHLPHIDILKVGHHGSKTSSSMIFLKQIQPKISIISSGKHNKYHHPSIETIHKLLSIHSKLFNTQDKGEISVSIDSKLTIKLNHGNH